MNAQMVQKLKRLIDCNWNELLFYVKSAQTSSSKSKNDFMSYITDFLSKLIKFQKTYSKPRETAEKFQDVIKDVAKQLSLKRSSIEKSGQVVSISVFGMPLGLLSAVLGTVVGSGIGYLLAPKEHKWVGLGVGGLLGFGLGNMFAAHVYRKAEERIIKKLEEFGL